jgi:hypothetical protein
MEISYACHARVSGTQNYNKVRTKLDIYVLIRSD